MTNKQTPKQKRKLGKGCAIFAIAFFVLFIVFLVKTGGSDSEPSNTWLEPTDVYLNLKKQNFDVKKLSDENLGVSWVCTLTNGNYNYNVSTYGADEKTLKSVQINVIATPPATAYECTSFYQMIGSTPYKGNDIEQSQKWILENISKDGATTVIGDARWTVNTKTKWSTIILLEPIDKK